MRFTWNSGEFPFAIHFVLRRDGYGISRKYCWKVGGFDRQHHFVAAVRSDSDADPVRPIDPEPNRFGALQKIGAGTFNQNPTSNSFSDGVMSILIVADGNLVDSVVSYAEELCKQDINCRAGPHFEGDKRLFDDGVPDVLELVPSRSRRYEDRTSYYGRNKYKFIMKIKK